MHRHRKNTFMRRQAAWRKSTWLLISRKPDLQLAIGICQAEPDITVIQAQSVVIASHHYGSTRIPSATTYQAFAPQMLLDQRIHSLNARRTFPMRAQNPKCIELLQS